MKICVVRVADQVTVATYNIGDGEFFYDHKFFRAHGDLFNITGGRLRECLLAIPEPLEIYVRGPGHFWLIRQEMSFDQNIVATMRRGVPPGFEKKFDLKVDV